MSPKQSAVEAKRLELSHRLAPHYPKAAAAIIAWLLARTGANSSSNPTFFDKCEAALAKLEAMTLEQQLAALNGESAAVVTTTVKVVPLEDVPKEPARPEAHPREPKTLLDWALDACRRGYAVHPLGPRSKKPVTPRGFYDATTDEEQIRKYWEADSECNPSIWPGKTGRTVVDIDHGLSSLEELRAWQERNHLPRVLAVRTGRRPGFGVQLHFDGATEYNSTWELDGCGGEIRSLRGYALAPGAIHPETGERYEIVEDRPLAPLPDIFRNLEEKRAAHTTPQLAAGEKVKPGQRHSALVSEAGRFRQKNPKAGSSETVAYLKAWAESHFETCTEFPDSEIQQIAEWAATAEASKPGPRVVIGDTKKPLAEEGPTLENYAFPADILEGDYIADMMHALTDGTNLPPWMMREELKIGLGAALSKLDYPGHPGLHSRGYLIKIAPTYTGKGETWLRTWAAAGWLHKILEAAGIKILEGDQIGSGPMFAAEICENPRCLIYYDEMRSFFERNKAVPGFTIESCLLSAYNRNIVGQKSFKNGKYYTEEAEVSTINNITPEEFSDKVAVGNSAGSGFLGRHVLAYSPKLNALKGDWEEINEECALAIVEKLVQCLPGKLKPMVSDRGIPLSESAEAKEMRLALGEELDKHPPEYTARIMEYMKRDAAFRVIFSRTGEISAEVMARAVGWGKHQLQLRYLLYPAFGGSPIGAMENSIERILTRRGPQTVSQLVKFTHARRAEGGREMFNRALRSLLAAYSIEVCGKTQRQQPIYRLVGEE